MATKVAQTLLEYGVNSSRLVMPTRENLLHLESLIDATTSLVEIKKNVDRVEQDIRLLKGELTKRDGQTGGGGNGETPMDVDQEALADDDEAGIQPGRGARKKNVGFLCKVREFGHLLTRLCYRLDDLCRYLLSTLQLNPQGQTKGRNRVRLLSYPRSHFFIRSLFRSGVPVYRLHCILINQLVISSLSSRTTHGSETTAD